MCTCELDLFKIEFKHDKETRIISSTYHAYKFHAYAIHKLNIFHNIIQKYAQFVSY